MPSDRPSQPTWIKILRLIAVMGLTLGFSILLIKAEDWGYGDLETAAESLTQLIVLPFGFLGIVLLWQRLHGKSFRTRRGPVSKGSLHDRICIALCAFGSPLVILGSVWSLAQFLA